MSTILFFHAHPDDEASQTAGVMARAASEGHRVVVVYATNGDHGDAPDDLADGESVVDRRRVEAARSAEVLGTARVAWLGYADSGMHGWEQNDVDGSFHGADPQVAAQALADIMDEEHPDVVVGYDWHGGYGHPDHVKVHNVFHRALGLTTATPRVYESTMNRDRMREMNRLAAESGMVSEEENFDPDQPMDDGNPLGQPEGDLSFFVDITPWIAAKRGALAAHASQSDARGLLAIPEDVFPIAFGHEHFIDVEAMRRSGRPSSDGHVHGSRPDGEPLPEGWFF